MLSSLLLVTALHASAVDDNTGGQTFRVSWDHNICIHLNDLHTCKGGLTVIAIYGRELPRPLICIVVSCINCELPAGRSRDHLVDGCEMCLAPSLLFHGLDGGFQVISLTFGKVEDKLAT